MKRIALGILVAPAVTGAVVAILVDAALGAFTAVFAYPASLLLGTPIHVLLQRIGWTRLMAYAAAGAALAVLSGVFYAVLLWHTNYHPPGVALTFRSELSNALRGMLDTPSASIFLAGVGALGAGTFWAIVRPDKPGNGDAT